MPSSRATNVRILFDGFNLPNTDEWAGFQVADLDWNKVYHLGLKWRMADGHTYPPNDNWFILPGVFRWAVLAVLAVTGRLPPGYSLGLRD